MSLWIRTLMRLSCSSSLAPRRLESLSVRKLLSYRQDDTLTVACISITFKLYITLLSVARVARVGRSVMPLALSGKEGANEVG